MQGFFTKKETVSLGATKGVMHSCAACGLYKDCRTPKMKPYGGFKKDILVIGEFPELEDDEKGKPWQSQLGRLLRASLDRYGIDLFEDCISLNAVNCRPPDRLPTATEIDHCRSVIVWKALEEYQPRLILVLGSMAVNSVIGHRMGGGLGRFRGKVIPDQDLKAWVAPLFDPGYLIRSGKPRDLMNIWDTELSRALDHLDKPFITYPKPKIELVDNLEFLNNWGDKLGAFDYETNALKPHSKKAEVVCVSISDSDNRAWVYMAPKNKKEWQPFRKWLNNPRIPKMAHNMKFEDSWSRGYLKVVVRGWEWDSMLAAHLIDNRKGISGLKVQNYINFGIVDYSDDVEPYLKSKEDSGNGINQIKKLLKSSIGRERLVEYCGLDSVYEYRLATKQMEHLNWDFLPF